MFDSGGSVLVPETDRVRVDPAKLIRHVRGDHVHPGIAPLPQFNDGGRPLFQAD